jgi:hypothetical protein
LGPIVTEDSTNPVDPGIDLPIPSLGPSHMSVAMLPTSDLREAMHRESYTAMQCPVQLSQTGISAIPSTSGWFVKYTSLTPVS